ncbi:hypothetical protein DL768_004389 [Monosporascus sp. mg162]|nr:hypothetical protein DL768_004389 [Monosporascus sp. mg162]
MELKDSKLQDRGHDGNAIRDLSANAGASPGNTETVYAAKPPSYGEPGPLSLISYPRNNPTRSRLWTDVARGLGSCPASKHMGLTAAVQDGASRGVAIRRSKRFSEPSWNGCSTGIFTEDGTPQGRVPFSGAEQGGPPGDVVPTSPHGHIREVLPGTPTGARSEAVRPEARAAPRMPPLYQLKGRRATKPGFLKHIANPWALLEDYY